MINILLSVALFAILKGALLRLGVSFDDHDYKTRTWHQRRCAGLFR